MTSPITKRCIRWSVYGTTYNTEYFNLCTMMHMCFSILTKTKLILDKFKQPFFTFLYIQTQHYSLALYPFWHHAKNASETEINKFRVKVVEENKTGKCLALNFGIGICSEASCNILSVKSVKIWNCYLHN